MIDFFEIMELTEEEEEKLKKLLIKEKKGDKNDRD